MTEKRRIAVWPVWVLAAPAAISIWSGWVGLGGMTGFGTVKLLPGIIDNFQINTAITLPIGMEAYAAYAFRVWLADENVFYVPPRARQFARWSSMAALILGVIGQVIFHVLSASGVKAADGIVTALVSCLPVGVLAFGATLAHLLRDSDEPSTPVVDEPVPAVHADAVWSDWPRVQRSVSSPLAAPEPAEVPAALSSSFPPELAPAPIPGPQTHRLSLADAVAAADRAPVVDPVPPPAIPEVVVPMNGSSDGTSNRAHDDTVVEPSVNSTNGISPRSFILSEWGQGRRVETSDLYVRFPSAKKPSLRAVLSTVRKDKPDLEPPVGVTDEGEKVDG